MNHQDIASLEKPDVQSLAKRAYVGPKSRSGKRHTLKLKRKQRSHARPRGRSGY